MGGGSYSSVKKSVYSTALANWANKVEGKEKKANARKEIRKK